jgi:HD-GYP domain-containing protein (c-di-GMP phosphodiesterase class II)
MLKRVAVSDVELGMFIHKLEGSWFDHPFWKSRFLLNDPENLRDLRASAVRSVCIDTSKGKDVAPRRALRHDPRKGPAQPPRPKKPEPRTAASRLDAFKSRLSADLKSTRPTSTAREVATAQTVANRAQKGLSGVFLDARLGKAIKTRTIEPMVLEIYNSVQRNPHAFSGLMRCKLNNEFVYRHGLAVSALMISLARKMRLGPDETYEAGLAGMFLDIGTNYLPADPPPRNGDYRNADPAIWRQHARLGFNALESVGGIPQTVLEACLQHHERIDGTGFPDRLSGAQISSLARMAAICDTFDYLLLDCEASSSLDPGVAIQALQHMKGAFDEEILHHFIESVGLYPVGSFVRLRSDRLAMVIDEDPEDCEHPVVKPFYSLKLDRRIQARAIRLAHCRGEDEIVGFANLSGLILPDEAQLRDLIFLSAHKSASD